MKKRKGGEGGSEEEEARSGRKQLWLDGGGRERGGGKQGEKVWKEGGGVLLKTGGQTVCNWLGPRGLKKRFKERRVEGDRGQINR